MNATTMTMPSRPAPTRTMSKQTSMPEARMLRKINGFDAPALAEAMRQIKADAGKGIVKFDVRTQWEGGNRSTSYVDGYEIGGQRVERQFAIKVDEPVELMGANTAPNPQEMLMTALNTCMMAGYVAGASMMGITLESLEIECDGQLDLRGFLGLDPDVKPGYEQLHYTVRIKGDGTPEQFLKIHQTVMATSPNRYNIANPIPLVSELVIQH